MEVVSFTFIGAVPFGCAAAGRGGGLRASLAGERGERRECEETTSVARVVCDER